MRAWQKTGLIVLFFLIVGYVGATAWMVAADWRILSYPKHYEFRWELWPKIGGGILLAAGFALTAWRIGVASRQAEAALEQAKTAAMQVAAIEDGQITERFSRAVEHLGACKADGEPNLEVRLGGIYALERIARESPKDHWPVMEILAAYLRENAPVDDGEAEEDELEADPRLVAINAVVGRCRADGSAAIAAIGRRKKRVEPRPIDLGMTDLFLADLLEADLQEADLQSTNLRGANLRRAILKSANLSCADLRGAILEEAQLHGVMIGGARLRGATLCGAILKGVDLSYSKDLTKDQLASAIIDEHTLLPDYLEQYKEELLEAQRGREQRNAHIGEHK